MSDQTAPRPFQVTDQVMIDGTPGDIWWIDPVAEGKDFAVAYIHYDVLNERGEDGTAVLLTPDLTSLRFQNRDFALADGDAPKIPATDAPQDHGPLAAHLSDRTLDKVLSRPAHVPSLVLLDRDAAAQRLADAVSDLVPALSKYGIGRDVLQALADYRAAVQS